MNWNIFRTKEKRTYWDGNELTEYEFGFFWKGMCPDCEGPLHEGPSGGASTNYKCGVCNSRYNHAFGVQRMTDGSYEWLASMFNPDFEIFVDGERISSISGLILWHNRKFKEWY